MTLGELLRYARIGIKIEHLINTTADSVILGLRVNDFAYIYKDYLDDDLEDLRILEEIELDNLS